MVCLHHKKLPDAHNKAFYILRLATPRGQEGHAISYDEGDAMS
jgi:hypothetical protein